MTGNQALLQPKAELQTVSVSGWQAAEDAHDAGQTCPDQGRYPANSVPNLACLINQALDRTDQIDHSPGRNGPCWFAALVADAKAGHGENLLVSDLMKATIQAGVACVHFEDQLSSARKCVTWEAEC